MRGYAFIDDSGIPVETGTNKEIPAGAVELPEGLNPVTAQLMYVQEGAWLMRPRLSLSGLVSAPDFRDSYLGLPEGTIARVTDVLGNEVMGTIEEVGGEIEIHLPDPGQYQIELEPPLPWIGETINVVSE